MNRIQTYVVVMVLALGYHVQAGEFYQNSEHGFSIDFPEGWAVKGSRVEETIIKGVHRDSENRLIQLTIASYELPLEEDLIKQGHGPLSQEECLKALTAIYGSGIKPVQKGSGSATVASYQAPWCQVEADFNFGTEKLTQLGRHYLFVHGKRLYRVSIHTTDGEEYLKAMLPTVETSIASLKFGS